ncbi:MAG: hypothetical protein AABW67_03060 [Nanoarchaeota archaeon]
MEKKCKFSYNEIDDSLIISCKEEDENIKENFMLDDIIFYLTGRGKIAGLQIKNASSLFSEYGYDKRILDNLKEISLIVTPRENSLFIGLNLISTIEEVKLALGRVFMPQLKAI